MYLYLHLCTNTHFYFKKGAQNINYAEVLFPGYSICKQISASLWKVVSYWIVKSCSWILGILKLVSLENFVSQNILHIYCIFKISHYKILILQCLACISKLYTHIYTFQNKKYKILGNANILWMVQINLDKIFYLF